MKETSLDIFCREAKRTSGKAGGKPVYTKEEEDALVAKAQAGDIGARNKLIEANLMFMYSHAKKKWGYKVPDEDALVSAAALGMVRAIDMYEIGPNRRLTRYAWRWIDNAIREDICALSYPLKIGDNTLRKVTRALRGGTPGNYGRLQYLLVDPLRISEDPLFAEKTEDTGGMMADEAVIQKETSEAIDDALDLVENEDFRSLIVEHFGLDGCGGKQLMEIADRLGTSQSNATRIKLVALRAMSRHKPLLDLFGTELSSYIAYSRPDGRTCIRCGVHKPREEFSKNDGIKSGIQTTCKECRKEEAEVRRDRAMAKLKGSV